MITSILALLLSAGATSASAQSAAPLPVLTDRDVALNIADRAAHFGSYFPDNAMNHGKEGVADIQCLVGDDHRLAQCAVIKENPAGWEFGAAAISFYAGMSAAPETKKGTPSTGRAIKLRVRFRLAR